MKKKLYALLLCLFFVNYLAAQFLSKEARDSINKLNQQDHQLMMKQLDLTEMRPGPSGNPEAPNAANADESKAKQYESLPDPHELVALCAPRPVFISSGSANVEGQWVDAKGMFLGGALASPVYQLLGKKGLGTMEFPPQETTLVDGDLAFRQHEGGHTTGPNWPYFIKFASRYFD